MNDPHSDDINRKLALVVICLEKVDEQLAKLRGVVVACFIGLMGLLVALAIRYSQTT